MSQLLRETAVPNGDIAFLDPPPDLQVVEKKAPPSSPDADHNDQRGSGDEDGGWVPDARDERQAAAEEARRVMHTAPARGARPAEIAIRLSGLETLAERIAFYKRVGIQPLNRAAAAYPALMPLLNGEFEWITLYAE
jgi:hypothetical protein